MFAWFFGKGPKPQFDRYTYWEKFDYMSLVAGTIIIGTTGFMMWFPIRTAQLLPGQFLNIAFVIHSNEALLAMGVIFIFVHLFSAHLKPESFPLDKVIFTGSCRWSTTAKSGRWSTRAACVRARSTRCSSRDNHAGRPMSPTPLVDHHPHRGFLRYPDDRVHHLVDLHVSATGRKVSLRRLRGGREVKTIAEEVSRVLAALVSVWCCAPARLVALAVDRRAGDGLPRWAHDGIPPVAASATQQRHAHRRQLHDVPHRLPERTGRDLLVLPRARRGHLQPLLAERRLQPDLSPLERVHEGLHISVHARHEPASRAPRRTASTATARARRHATRPEPAPQRRRSRGSRDCAACHTGFAKHAGQVACTTCHPKARRLPPLPGQRRPGSRAAAAATP